MLYGAVGRVGIRSFLGGFSPISLFSAGEQGVWYDPSDFSTMFQDSAGTTPVTAVEQPVGLILDKSGRGNHASQSTSASRPVLSARVNQLTYSEQFDNAVWIVARSGTAALGVKTNNYGIAPDGTTTAARIQLDVSAGSVGNQSQVYQTYQTAAGVNYSRRVWVRTNDSSTKTIMGFSTNAASPETITVTGTWSLFTTTRTSAGTTDNLQFILIKGTTSDTADLLVWHPDVRATNDGVGIPAYQRIAAATDYDTTGFPYYIRFDGTDDSLATASVDFSATNAMSVFAGVRKLSDAARGMVVELGTGVSASGAFSLNAPNSAANDISFRTAGTGTQAIATASGIAAPITRVLTGIGEIATDTCILRGNGVELVTSATDQGAGNYINGALYIGRRNSATLPYNGRLYSLIVRGAQSTATEITNTETWVNGKTMAY
jgi:hypothetical protein